MHTARIAEMFENDKQWLLRQPEINSWERACACLAEQLERWLREYSKPLCEQVVAEKHPEYPSYVNRLWRCWGYHWLQAAGKSPDGKIRGQEVAERIRAGKGYSRGGRLGGDPLRDVVLAVALGMKENEAAICFQTDYYDFSRHLAGKQNHRFMHDVDDWWNEFVDFLAGYTQPPGKLERFIGKCALRNWLGTVLWNFLRRRPLPEGINGDDLPDNPTSPADDVAQQECLALFTRLVAEAFDKLPKDDRLLLRLLYVDGLQLKQAAAVIGVVPGQASRRRGRAIQRFQQLLSEQVADSEREESYQDCLQYLMEDPRDFAVALCDVLEDSLAEEDV